MSLPLPEPFLYFRGNWQLEREIFTKSTGTLQAKASGVASFRLSEAGNSLRYQEKGKVKLTGSGSELGFTRRFRYDFRGQGLHIFFDDGPDAGSFYQAYIYDPGTQKLVAEQVHVCGPDLYQGAYLLTNENSFFHFTTIEGKAKDMLIKTRYTRSI